MDKTLLIKSGGIIKYTHYDIKKKEMVVDDVTTKAPYFLMNETKLDEDVTLRDVFTILERDIDTYKVIINNWVEEFTEEAKLQPKEKAST